MLNVKAKISSDGNIKLGNMGVWSVLYGNQNHYVPGIGMMSGTCGHHCECCTNQCYVKKSYRYDTVRQGHGRNTYAIRADIKKCFSDLDGQLSRKRKPFEYIRINQSGELENKNQFDMWVRLAEKHPETIFYLYTKAYEIVIPELLAESVPHNLIVLISVWHNVGIQEYKTVSHLNNVKAFVYDDSTFDYSELLNIQTYCKAYDDKGRMNHNITCDKCRKCCNHNKNHKIIGCKAH